MSKLRMFRVIAYQPLWRSLSWVWGPVSWRMSLPRFHRRTGVLWLGLLGCIVCLVSILRFVGTPQIPTQIRSSSGQYGRGGVLMVQTGSSQMSDVTQKTCGHPAEVFQDFGFSTNNVPPASVLKTLPTPQKQPVQKAGDLSYDPTTDQLCSMGWQGIYTNYVQTSADASSPTPDSSAAPPNTASTGWVQDTLQGLLNTVLRGLGDFLNGVLSWAKTFGFLFITPDGLTYNHPVVRNLNAWMVGLMGSLVMLVLVVGGYNTLFGSQQMLRELAPRLLGAGIAGAFSLFFLTQFIELQNALDLSFLKALASAGVGDLSLPLGVINWATSPEYEIITYLIDLLMSVLLCMQMLVRIGLLNFELVVAPLAFLCFALPQTLAWARLWVQAFVSTLLLQFFQTVCIGLGSTLLASFGHSSNSVITILVGIATLYVAWKLPNMLLSNVLQASVGQVNRDFGRAMQTVTEMVALKAA